jgi:hypothetical protein
MMLRAWTFGLLGNNPGLAERLQSAVLDTLKWMAHAWKDVTNPFHARFTRAMQHVHLDYYSHARRSSNKSTRADTPCVGVPDAREGRPVQQRAPAYPRAGAAR